MSPGWIIISMLFWLLNTNCMGHEEGPEELQCLAQDSYFVYGKSPYQLKATVIVEEDADDIYIVTLTSDDRKYLEGFLLEARAKNDPSTPLGGYFSTQPNTRRKSCGLHSNNTLTHEIGKQVRNLVVTWTPPTGFQGVVVFRSYVIDKPNLPGIYLKIIPKIIRRKNNIVHDNRTSLPLSKLPESMEEATKDCGSRRGCFGLPADCLDTDGSCEVLVSFEAQRDGVNFQLTGRTSRDVSWIAVGLSHDEKMGDDSVTDCIFLDSGKILIQQSWNYESPKRNKVLRNPSEGIFNMKGKMSHGSLSCTWTRQYDTIIHGLNFDLLRTKWHLLLAKGPVKHGEKTKHHGAIASEKSYNLTSHSLSFEPLVDGTDDEDRPEMENRVRRKELTSDTYKKYLTVIRGQVDQARKELSNAVRVLNEAVSVQEASVIKTQKKS